MVTTYNPPPPLKLIISSGWIDLCYQPVRALSPTYTHTLASRSTRADERLGHDEQEAVNGCATLRSVHTQ